MIKQRPKTGTKRVTYSMWDLGAECTNCQHRWMPARSFICSKCSTMVETNTMMREKRTATYKRSWFFGDRWYRSVTLETVNDLKN